MKHLLTAIACCLAVAGSAQFIPQPMGYNPDSNSDGVIGSEDLMGMLSLYGSEYSNSDSINVEFIDLESEEPDTVVVSEDIDILYLTQTGDWTTYVQMPSGSTWKVVQVFPRPIGFTQWEIDFLFPNPPPPLCYGGTCELEFASNGPHLTAPTNAGKYVTLIRGHDGTWYSTEY